MITVVHKSNIFVYFPASLSSLEVVIVSPDDKSSGQLLPCLVHGKVKLFQVNSASQYLHELAQAVGQDQEDSLEEQLQWEAIYLRPAVLSVLNGLIQVTIVILNL